MNRFSTDIARGDVRHGAEPWGRDGGHEKIPKVSSLCRSGGGEAPKNVMKTDDFYRAKNQKQDLIPLF
jgi:hypothetical protein